MMDFTVLELVPTKFPNIFIQVNQFFMLTLVLVIRLKKPTQVCK